MNPTSFAAVLAALLLSLTLGACQRRRAVPEIPKLEERRDRAFYEGTPRMQEELRVLFSQASQTTGTERAQIGQRILSYGEVARPLLIEKLSDEDAAMRVFAAWLLGVSDDTRAIEPLDGLRADPDEAVRFEAATAMVRLGDSRGLETLVDGLSHTDPRVRNRSIRQLELATGDAFGYRSDDHRDERDAAIRRWRAWILERNERSELR